MPLSGNTGIYEVASESKQLNMGISYFEIVRNLSAQTYPCNGSIPKNMQKLPK
jgi:hypothetical protein